MTAYAGDREADCWQRRIGLRTVTVRREPDEYGESFTHEVNGVQIFAMGADYIPEDNLLSRVTPERTRKLLEQCTAATVSYTHLDVYKRQSCGRGTWRRSPT